MPNLLIRSLSVYVTVVRQFHSYIIQLEKTPEYDRICKLLNQPIRLSSGLRDSSFTQQQRQLTNPVLGQQQQQQQSQNQQHQQQLKQQQLKQQQQRQLKQQQKHQQQHKNQLQQQQYKVLNRNDRISSQQNRSTATGNNTFGMQNANRRSNFRVSICHVDRRCH